MDGIPDATDTCPGTCPSAGGITTTTNSASGRAQEVIIYSVDHVQDIVVLRNTGSNTVDLSNGDLCVPFNYAAFPNGTSIAPGADLTVHLTAAGTNTATDIYLNNARMDMAAADVVVLYRVAAGHTATGMEAFVRWGTGAQSGRMADAVTAGLWTNGDAVTICPEHDGFAASGDITTEGGFTSLYTSQTCP